MDYKLAYLIIGILIILIFFKNNKSKYKKEGGGFNMKQAQKDFAKTQKK